MSDFEDDLQVRCLEEAFAMFPDGCACEDNLECGFCRHVVTTALRLGEKRKCTAYQTARREPRDECFASDVPVSEELQVYELRRMLRL